MSKWNLLNLILLVFSTVSKSKNTQTVPYNIISGQTDGIVLLKSMSIFQQTNFKPEQPMIIDMLNVCVEKNETHDLDLELIKCKNKILDIKSFINNTDYPLNEKITRVIEHKNYIFG